MKNNNSTTNSPTTAHAGSGISDVITAGFIIYPYEFKCSSVCVSGSYKPFINFIKEPLRSSGNYELISALGTVVVLILGTKIDSTIRTIHYRNTMCSGRVKKFSKFSKQTWRETASELKSEGVAKWEDVSHSGETGS